MGKVQLKGGLWTNVEDEILKAAIMKYGKNQWARISSLLVRKTPKQCKARWTEWLDPMVRKTEWTQPEEEKLLHLAKVMPQQWRTIAPIIGRTAAQCLEHYEHLLDQAQQADAESVNEGPSLAELKQPREGERDAAPESRPSRPDPVDMDEDEKEMLAEARARLANTQGKKAKRKARLRMLEDAKRETAAKKEEDMAAAGITSHVRKQRRGKKAPLDYNMEIPFEMQPAPGLFDIQDELQNDELRKEEHDKLVRKKRQLTKTRELQELEARKQDIEKDKVRVSKGYLPAAVERQSKIQQAERIAANQAFKLPAPIMNDGRLEAAAKAGLRLEEAKSLGQTPGTEHSIIDATPYSQSSSSWTPRSLSGDNRERVLSSLRSLPAPKNEYQINRPK